MVDVDGLTLEQKHALDMTTMSALKKKINADGWTNHAEDILKSWGEKAAGLRWMHNHSAGLWKRLSDRLSLSGIVITTIASTASLAAAGVDDSAIVMYGVGAVGMIGALIQSLKKFYNSEEKNADHASIAKQYGSFYRYLVMELGMSREDRRSSDELCAWALKEYERLHQEAPSIHGSSVEEFKKTFKGSTNVPDIAETKFEIEIYDPESENDETNPLSTNP